MKNEIPKELYDRIKADIIKEWQEEQLAKRLEVNLDNICEFVCEQFDTTKDMLESKSRRRETCILPRRMFYYLAKKYAKSSKRAAGKYFNQDHATVVHSINEARKDMQFIYSETGKEFNRIEEIFKLKFNPKTK